MYTLNRSFDQIKYPPKAKRRNQKRQVQREPNTGAGDRSASPFKCWRSFRILNCNRTSFRTIVVHSWWRACACTRIYLRLSQFSLLHEHRVSCVRNFWRQRMQIQFYISSALLAIFTYSHVDLYRVTY